MEPWGCDCPYKIVLFWLLGVDAGKCGLMVNNYCGPHYIQHKQPFQIGVVAKNFRVLGAQVNILFISLVRFFDYIGFPLCGAMNLQ